MRKNPMLTSNRKGISVWVIEQSGEDLKPLPLEFSMGRLYYKDGTSADQYNAGGYRIYFSEEAAQRSIKP